MILKILSHTGQLLDEGNVVLLEELLAAETGELEDLRRADGTSTEDDFATSSDVDTRSLCVAANSTPRARRLPSPSTSVSQMMRVTVWLGSTTRFLRLLATGSM